MRGYSHLSDDEREQIGLLKVLGHSIGAIARALRRPKSTISRELSRNRLPSGRYSPLHAAGAYQLRRRREALIERKTEPCGASFSTASPKGGRPHCVGACRCVHDAVRNGPCAGAGKSEPGATLK